MNNINYHNCNIIRCKIYERRTRAFVPCTAVAAWEVVWVSPPIPHLLPWPTTSTPTAYTMAILTLRCVVSPRYLLSQGSFFC